MSFLSALTVSVSGMTAQRQRVNTISENIANAQTPHPDANAEGYVEMPNVKIIEEMVNLMTASRAYEANAAAFNAAKGMAQAALDLGRA